MFWDLLSDLFYSCEAWSMFAVMVSVGTPTLALFAYLRLADDQLNALAKQTRELDAKADELRARTEKLRVREIDFLLCGYGRPPPSYKLYKLNVAVTECTICCTLLASNPGEFALLEGCLDCAAVCHSHCVRSYVAHAQDNADEILCILCRQPYLARRWMINVVGKALKPQVVRCPRIKEEPTSPEVPGTST